MSHRQKMTRKHKKLYKNTHGRIYKVRTKK
jgi:hypothetical protein